MFKLSKILNPIFLFITIWLLMLTTYSLQISYFMPCNAFLLFVISFISILSFLGGYLFIYIVFQNMLYKNRKERKIYKPNGEFFIYINKLRLIYIILFTLIFFIIFYNFITYGYPPIMSFFSGSLAINYMNYGRFKGILFPALSILFLISTFDRNRILSGLVKFFTILTFIIYVTRGFIISTLIQYFFLKLLLTKRIRKLKFFTYVIFIIIIVLVIMGKIGDLRTGNEVFKRVMEIKEEFSNLPASLLWFIGYISFPLANLIHFIKDFNNFYCGLITLNNLLPAFINILPSNFHSFYKNLLPNQFNTVSTYLGYIYLDFGFWGIIFMNIILGALSYFFYRKAYVNVLATSIFYSSLILIFFSNFIFFFPFVFEMILAIFIQKLIISKGT